MLNMKTLKHTVRLVLFSDNSGRTGTTHVETYDGNSGDGFNAFWDGRGMFHDVFEHSQEEVHPWFRKAAKLNVGGEMWASGAMMYYYYGLGAHSRFLNREAIYTNEQQVVNNTLTLVTETLSDGYCNFGRTLISHVPKQPEVDSYMFNSMLQEYEYCLNKDRREARSKWAEKKADPERNRYYGEDEHQSARDYAKSVTMPKIANLHRGGWHWAEDLVPNSPENTVVMEEFIEFWDGFCKANPAESLELHYKGIDFEIFHDEREDFQSEVSWRATIKPQVGAEYPAGGGDELLRILPTVIDSDNLPKRTDGTFNFYHEIKTQPQMEFEHA